MNWGGSPDMVWPLLQDNMMSSPALSPWSASCCCSLCYLCSIGIMSNPNSPFAAQLPLFIHSIWKTMYFLFLGIFGNTFSCAVLFCSIPFLSGGSSWPCSKLIALGCSTSSVECSAWSWAQDSGWGFQHQAEWEDYFTHLTYGTPVHISPHDIHFLQQSEVVGVRFVARGNSPTIHAVFYRVCTNDCSNMRFTLVLAEWSIYVMPLLLFTKFPLMPLLLFQNMFTEAGWQCFAVKHSHIFRNSFWNSSSRMPSHKFVLII